MEGFRTSTLMAALAAGLALGACDRAAPPAPASAVNQAASPAARKGLQPCEILATAHVADVLPGAMAGTPTHAGGSLIQGVDAYQCAYTNAAGDLFTLILNVAADDAAFEAIKPGSAVQEGRQQVGVGDAGWLSVAADEVKLKAVQGRTVIDLELMATGASGKSSLIVALGQAVASKIR